MFHSLKEMFLDPFPMVYTFRFARVCSNVDDFNNRNKYMPFKETKSATMNIFRNFYFLFKSFVKVELSYAFKINMFTIAENCTESELSYNKKYL